MRIAITGHRPNKLDTCHKGIRVSKYFKCEYRASVYYDIISLALKGEFALTNHDKNNYSEKLISKFYSLFLKKFYA